MKLFAHQERAVRIAHKIPKFIFAWDCGCGKTIGMLAACEAVPMRTIVVCPKSIMSPAWMRDAANFPAIRTKILAAASKPQRKANILADDWDIGIVNFDQFKSERETLARAGVRRLIVDESSKMKNHEAAITKSLIAFADQCESVYLLSGTPAPNNVTEYWAQIRAIRKDLSGDLFWKWAHRYATAKKRRVWQGGSSREVVEGWSQTEPQRKEFEELLGRCSWSLRKEDAMDLPKQTDVVVRFPLGDEGEHYERALTSLRIELGSDPIKINAEAALMKLRQICGGFVIANGNPTKIGNSKLSVLDETLDQIGPRPCLIWAEFRHEIDAIRGLCESRGETVEYIDGRTSGDAGDIAERFQSGEVQRLVCHPAAAGHGITLTAASYAVYYSLGFSYELYKQSRDRIHRAGQTMPCTYYILTAEETVDEGCLGCVRNKGTAADALAAALAV